MKALQEKFGAKGTPVSDIFKTLGQPNAMLPVYQPNKLNPEPGTPGHFHQYMMPGPVIPPPPAQAQGGAGGQQEPHGEVSIGLPAAQPPTAVAPPFDLMYYWRGRHDYMWFRIDPTTEKVIASDWYHAYE
ncbi:hypothetical protein GQ42DRAFT_161727 [Ramicandelaber brevisporus]|nr:hypothetical protein GQ42DRAFT_161727 [Ramicandelaber brevisporus]